MKFKNYYQHLFKKYNPWLIFSISFLIFGVILIFEFTDSFSYLINFSKGIFIVLILMFLLILLFLYIYSIKSLKKNKITIFDLFLNIITICFILVIISMFFFIFSLNKVITILKWILVPLILFISLNLLMIRIFRGNIKIED